jgi:hypothetical protein
LDEEKSKCAGLAQQINWFSLQQNCRAWQWLVEGEANLCTCKEECNKYDLSAAECFLSAHHIDWFKWFAINSPPIYLPSRVSVLWVGLLKRKLTRLGCEKYFLRVT